ncbi:MAG: cyclic nucleotide-binding domain-containing protein [Silicimonas sp.]|nr:cyclic nucleotide-binding domain-containing protein [Silicimonas sp.]
MPSDLPFGPEIFAHGALLFFVIGLLMRDGLRLRLFLLCGTGCYLAYYFTIADKPLWDAIVSSTAIALTNIFAIARLLLESTTFTMSKADKDLYRHFPTMTPGQFRRILRQATRKTATAAVVLTREGEPPEGLFFVTEGPLTMERDAQRISLEPGKFIGEISFIRGPDVGASARVELGAGAQYVEWDRKGLRRLLEKSQPLSNAISALFNRDLSSKLIQSWPAARK